MDRGRNLEALAEEDGEEEMEDERHRDSDSDGSSSSDDDAPDTGTRRGEPNKFDILCDGVNNSMALVHTALEELLDMKDEMLKHSLPPTLLIKLATNTGKVFRSISDLNMPINELIRLVRVYSTPWEEKSAALKKLHEDYEAKQRQLNIAIKRLQLVDAHSKRIAKEKRVMNWEKLFAKMMSNKGHGRRWKFLIETIKQKAKLGLEHVQEFTRALDESSDEEDDEMPRIELKSQQRDSSATPSEKISEGDTENELEEGEEEEEAGGEPDEQGESDERSEVSSATKEVPSIKIGMEDDEEEEEEEEEITGAGSESSKKVRFATAASSAISTPKVETRDAEVWTDAPEYDQFLFVRMYAPVSMVQTDIKCSVTFGKQFYKSKRLDGEGGVDRMDGKTPTSDMLREKKASEIKRGRYEEAKFTMADWVPEGVWQGDGPRDEGPNNCQITIHSGPMEEIIAMATIDIADLHELDLKRVFLPEPHGDDDVPKSPEPDIDNDTDSLSSDVDIPLPDDDAKVKEEPHVDYVKDVEPMMFPLYSLDSSSTTHKPCGNLPLIIYWGNRLRCTTFNRQTGTYGVSDLVFEMTGIDLDSTTKEDLNKQMVEQSLSAIGFVPDVQDRALSAMRLTPIELEPPQPPSSPESEVISEHISPEFKEYVPQKPAEELVPKYELDRVVEKHSKDMLFLQEEYEKRLQGLLLSIQSLEESKAFHQQQLLQQQQQLQEQQRKLSKRSADLRKTADRQQTLSPAVTSAPPATPANIIGPDSEEVSRPIIHAPMPPQKPKKGSRSRPTFVPKPQQQWQGVPEDFLERLQYFEEESYRHKQDLLDKTKQEIQADIEKKLAGQHKLSRKEEELYEALNDVSLPALFMPFSRGTLFNPRAHQYFHATGSSELRLTQPPSVFQLPPLHKNKSSILNLFELSKNFNTRGPGWLMDRYIQQQEPVQNTHGMAPLTSMATSQLRSPPFTPEPTFDMPSVKGESRKRVLEQEAEC